MQQKEVVATPKALKKALEHEKTPELAVKLAAEAIERDPWAAQVSQLSLPKLVEQVALNAWKRRATTQYVSFALLSAAFEQPRCTAKTG